LPWRSVCRACLFEALLEVVSLKSGDWAAAVCSHLISLIHRQTLDLGLWLPVELDTHANVALRASVGEAVDGKGVCDTTVDRGVVSSSSSGENVSAESLQVCK